MEIKYDDMMMILY